MTPKLIDINDYVHTGAGANGSSYDCISNPEMMIKLYNTTYPQGPVFSEYEVAKKVYECGFPCPEPGELVTDGERIGIQFKKIPGKRSYARAIAQEPERLEEYVREFAQVGKKLHATECPKGVFPDIRDSFKHMIEAHDCYDAKQKEKIISYLYSLPDCMTAIHGDYQIGNVVTTLPQGAPMDQPHDVYLIDLGYFSHGYPLLDLGILNICMNYIDEDLCDELYHINMKQANKVWEVFVDEYFFGAEKLGEKYFGKGTTHEQVNEHLFKLMAIQAFLVTYNAGQMFPYIDRMIRKAFDI